MRKFLPIALIGLLVCFASCIREEAPNAEADILGCTIPGVEIREITIDQIPDASSQEHIFNIEINLEQKVDVKQLAPEFVLTKGATIVPENGSKHDFTTPQKYVVTSEDGHWTKTYVVKIMDVLETVAYSFNRFTFEEPALLDKSGRYQVFSAEEMRPSKEDPSKNDTIKMVWGTGNSGYALTDMARTPFEFPTCRSNDGYTGKCIKLETHRTGGFGEMVKMPIAAGNLFIGYFDSSTALTNSLASTKFGMTWEKEPVAVNGWFKFKSGETFYELDVTKPPHFMREIAGKKDRFNICAVFYESTSSMKVVDGNNYLDPKNENIIKIAQINPDECIETEEWTRFSIPFEFRAGKSVDAQKLADKRYKLAIIFTSSVNGDKFSGAPGSTLLVDEVTIDYR